MLKQELLQSCLHFASNQPLTHVWPVDCGCVSQVIKGAQCLQHLFILLCSFSWLSAPTHFSVFNPYLNLIIAPELHLQSLSSRL